MRVEHDMLGERTLPDDAWYGIHSLRATENFQVTGRATHPQLNRALLEVKKAAAIVNRDLGLLDRETAEAVIQACDRLIRIESERCVTFGCMKDADCGSSRIHDASSDRNDAADRVHFACDSHAGVSNPFITDALQGGAGTSANMNVNEVVANHALAWLGHEKGDYARIHPLDHVNLSQSTNDVFPTAVRIAAIRMLLPLAEAFADLQTALQRKEEEFSDILKVGRTQLQDAVPVLLGQEFGAMAQSVARDRWRLYKAEERLRVVNLGGTAIGTGLNAERRYVFKVTETLRGLTGLGLARSDTMIDGTQNCDVFVEVSGLVKTAAVNLSKIANDLRLLASGPRAGIGEIRLPAVQAGSSIMPGKVNPVIPEMVNQVAFHVYGLDTTITMAAQSGQLELNAFLPLIADSLFDMLGSMTRAVRLLTERCIKGIEADRERCADLLEQSWALATALSGRIGHEETASIVQECRVEGLSVRQVLARRLDGVRTLVDLDGNAVSEDELERMLSPLEMTKPGIPGRRPGKKGILT